MSIYSDISRCYIKTKNFLSKLVGVHGELANSGTNKLINFQYFSYILNELPAFVRS